MRGHDLLICCREGKAIKTQAFYFYGKGPSLRLVSNVGSCKRLVVTRNQRKREWVTQSREVTIIALVSEEPSESVSDRSLFSIKVVSIRVKVGSVVTVS